MSDPAETVVLKRFPDELSALLLVGNLRSQGIHAVSVGGFMAQLRAEAPATVAVLVRAADLALAEEIVAELESSEVLDGPDLGDEGEFGGEDGGEEEDEFGGSSFGGDDDEDEEDGEDWESRDGPGGERDADDGDGEPR